MDMELAYLKQALPEDWAQYPRALMEEFARHAAGLRQTADWCAALPEEAYLHYVVCPRVNDEDLSSHRPLFYRLLWDRVKGLNQEDAVLEVNRWCHEQASYQTQDDRTASPRTVFFSGVGRCGEESGFLVAALRSVGLAARQVYVPKWSHCDDNHAWVEALCGGRWRFLGACEPEPILDRGWFNTAASRAMLVHSRTFGPVYDLTLHGAPLDRQGQALCHNQTARYARTKRYIFRAAPGERVRLEVLNEARFLPLAELTADEDGLIQVELGVGDLHLSAGRREAFCCGAETDGAGLTEPPAYKDWTAFTFRAPAAAAVNPAPLTAEQKRERSAVLARGDAVRTARRKGWFNEERAARFPSQTDLLRAARGNFGEIYAFLSRDSDPLREALLRSLTEKDLRDVRAEVLEGHLRRAAPWAGRYPEEVFRRFLLCPRIAWERLTDWSVLPDGPAGEAAALRKAGTPAYLRSLDGAVLVWRDGRFCPAVPEETGQVYFHRSFGESFRYRHNWSLARWDGRGWQELLLRDRAWQRNRLFVRLPAGRYRVLTSLRLPGGDQFASRLEFPLAPGERRDLALSLRTCEPSDLIALRDLSQVDGRPRQGRAALLLWLEEGAEPTEHLLNELNAQRVEFDALSVEPTAFLRSPEAERQPTLARLLAAWPALHTVYPEDWACQTEELARQFSLEPDRLPLAILCDRQGRAAYAFNGYQVGAADLLRWVAAALCDSDVARQ